MMVAQEVVSIVIGSGVLVLTACLIKRGIDNDIAALEKKVNKLEKKQLRLSDCLERAVDIVADITCQAQKSCDHEYRRVGSHEYMNYGTSLVSYDVECTKCKKKIRMSETAYKEHLKATEKVEVGYKIKIKSVQEIKSTMSDKGCREISFNVMMHKYCGKILTVSNIDCYYNAGSVLVEENDYRWHPSWFDVVKVDLGGDDFMDALALTYGAICSPSSISDMLNAMKDVELEYTYCRCNCFPGDKPEGKKPKPKKQASKKKKQARRVHYRAYITAAGQSAILCNNNKAVSTMYATRVAKKVTCKNCIKILKAQDKIK